MSEKGVASAAAAKAAGIDEATLRKLTNPTLCTIKKIAKGLDCDPAWLAFGVTRGEPPPLPPNMIVVDRDLLKDAVRFVLESAGAPDAKLTSEIFPEALTAPPIEAVDQDRLVSFRIRLQLGAERSSNLRPR